MMIFLGVFVGFNEFKIDYYIFEQAPKSSNRSYPSFNSKLLKSIPIRCDKPILRSRIAELAVQIHQEKVVDVESDTNQLEFQIDQLVYELYDLTEEEIEIIENA